MNTLKYYDLGIFIFLSFPYTQCCVLDWSAEASVSTITITAQILEPYINEWITWFKQQSTRQYLKHYFFYKSKTPVIHWNYVKNLHVHRQEPALHKCHLDRSWRPYESSPAAVQQEGYSKELPQSNWNYFKYIYVCLDLK